jgi:hypothetical protein
MSEGLKKKIRWSGEHQYTHIIETRPVLLIQRLMCLLQQELLVRLGWQTLSVCFFFKTPGIFSQ